MSKKNKVKNNPADAHPSDLSPNVLHPSDFIQTTLDKSTNSYDNDIQLIGNSIKLLVVDDDPVVGQLIKNYLKAYNYRVETRYDGNSALKLIFQEGDFDLLILDIMMPKMNGFEVAREIRATYSLFELPILILTAKDEINDLVEGFDSGANDFLLKPFDGNELIARARSLIKLRRLTKANSILQQALQMKNEFLNMTVHDLRNPLNVILGISNMLKAGDVPDNIKNDMIQLINESSALMSNLINELLENATLDSGKIILNKQIVDFNETAADIIARNKPLADRKNQNLYFNPGPANSCFFHADKIRIYEILDNLVNNAIKFTPKGKSIFVSVTNLIKNNQKFVSCEIRDEGPGLTKDDMTKLFGKFQKLSAQSTGGEFSSGLGLSIVKQLVDLHDGIIWAESEPGKGTSFFVNFPVKVQLV